MGGLPARRTRGFTLVELMIVVAMVGVLASLAILSVRRYVAASKTAEAKQVVGAIARSAAYQYERERDISEILLAGGTSAANVHFLCGSAGPVPATFSLVQGTKYQPNTAAGADFQSGTAIAGWQCLNFSISAPIYFQYSYLVGSGYVSQGLPGAPLPAGPEAFEAAARGDLDADSIVSTMTRVGEVRNGQLALSTNIYLNNETE